MPIYILIFNGCTIEMENTVKHFAKLSVTAERRSCAGFVMQSGNQS